MANPASVILSVGGNFTAFNQGLQTAVSNAQRTMAGAKFANPLGTISKDVKNFEQSLQAASQRVIAFSASLGTLAAVATIFKTIVKDTVAVQQAFVDINSVFQLSSANLQKFSKDLFDAARQTSQTFDVATEAAKEFSRQGLDAAETLKRVRDAMILTRASGLDINKSVETLTATINSFNSASVDSTRIINKLVAVDQNFAVSAKDLAEALSRVGSTAQDAGVSFDQLIGLVTAAQQTTARGGSVIGNSFKTIFTRIGRADTLQQLEDLNIQVRDLSGNALDAVTVMSNLSKKFDNLSESAKAQAAELVGGVFQINVLRSVLRDLGKEQGIAAQATRISSSASDEAIKRNEALNKSLQSLLTQTQLTTKQIAATVGQVTFSERLSGALGILNKNPITEALKNIDISDAGVTYGKEFGSGLAEGIFAGIGNILTGPALVYITKILSKVAKQTFAVFGGDLIQLAGMTGEMKKQTAVTQTLNGLYAAGNVQLQNQLTTVQAITAQLGAAAQTSAIRTVGGKLSPAQSSSLLNNIYSNAGGSLGMYGVRSRIPPTIQNSIDSNRATSIDKVFVQTAQREMSESGRNLAESMDIARRELLMAGANVKMLNSAIIRNASALDRYETELRTNQQNAITNINLNRAKGIISRGGKLDPSGLPFKTLVSSAQAETEQFYRNLIGKSESDVLSPKEREQLARRQARAESRLQQQFAIPYGPQLPARGMGVTPSLWGRTGAFLRRQSFATSFALPFAAGFIPEGAGGTAGGQALGATSGALQGAGIGAAIAPGPWGVIGGAIIGAGTGFVNKLRQSFEELAKQIEEANAKNAKLINQASEFSRISEALRSSVSSGASDKDIKTLFGQQKNVFSSIVDNDIRRKFIAANGDATKEDDIIAELARKTGIELSARDVAGSISQLNRSRGLVGRYTGAQAGETEFNSLVNTLQTAIQKGIDNNGPGFKNTISSQFRSDPVAALRGLGVRQEEFPELFKELSVALRDVKDAAAQAAANIEDFSDGALNAKLKQSNFSKEIAILSQGLLYSSGANQRRLTNNIEISRAISDARTDILGLSASSALSLRGGNQLNSIAALGSAQFGGQLGVSKNNIIQSMGGNIDNNLVQALLKARDEQDIAVLEKIANNSDVKSAIRQAVYELQAIKDNTRLELEKTSTLIEISKIQGRLEDRAKILQSGRFNEDVLSNFSESRINSRGNFGFSPEASRANNILNQFTILESMGITGTDNTSKIKSELSLISVTAQLSRIVESITGKNTGSNIYDIRKSAQEGIKNLTGTSLDKSADRDMLQSVVDSIEKILLNPSREAEKLSKSIKSGIELDNNPLSRGFAQVTNAISGPDGTNDKLQQIYNSLSKASTSFSAEKSKQQDKAEGIRIQEQKNLIQSNLKMATMQALRGKYNSGPSGRGEIESNLDPLIYRMSMKSGMAPNLFNDRSFVNAFREQFLTSVESGGLGEFRERALAPDGKIFSAAKNSDVFRKILESNYDGAGFSENFAKFVDDFTQQLAAITAPAELTDATKNLNETIQKLDNSLEFLNKLSELRKGLSGDISPTLQNISQTLPGSFLQNATVFPFGSSKARRRLSLPTGERSYLAQYNGPISPGLSEPKNVLDVAMESLESSKKNPNSQLFYSEQVGDVKAIISAKKELYDIETKINYLQQLRNGKSTDEAYILKQIKDTETELNLLYEARKRGELIGGSTFESASLNVANAKGLAGDSLGSFTGGFQSPFARMRAEMLNFAEVGATVANSLERNFSDAFGNFAIGAMKGRDAFRSFVVSILQDASRAFASKAVQNLLGMVINSSLTPTKTIDNSLPGSFASGGMASKSPAMLTAGEIVVPKEKAVTLGYDTLHSMNSYAFGGLVKGGSGVKDDVFKMLRPGDFVLKKSAVEKYGSDNLLEMVRAGRVQKKFLGGAIMGALLGGGIGYATGGKKGAIAGAVLGGIGGGFAQDYLKNAGVFKNTGAALATKSGAWSEIGKQFGGAGLLGVISALAAPKPDKPGDNTLPSLTLSSAETSRMESEAQERALRANGAGFLMPVETADGFVIQERARVAATRRFANGGLVPTAVMGGEAVIPREVVNAVGARNFANGGFVGSPSINMNPAGGSNSVRDININITMNKDGTVSQENSNQQNDGSQGEELGRKIRGAVLEVLSEQTRQGGTLYQAYGTSRMSR